MKYFILSLISTMISAVSIFEFPGDDCTLEIIEGTKICEVKYVSPNSPIHKTVSECLEIGMNLAETINLIKQKSKNRKEIIFSFFNEGSAIRPYLKSNGKEWKLAGIVFNFKENLYRLEIYDLDGKYFYLEKEIQNIKIVVNKK